MCIYECLPQKLLSKQCPLLTELQECSSRNCSVFSSAEQLFRPSSASPSIKPFRFCFCCVNLLSVMLRHIFDIKFKEIFIKQEAKDFFRWQCLNDINYSISFFFFLIEQILSICLLLSCRIYKFSQETKVQNFF